MSDYHDGMSSQAGLAPAAHAPSALPGWLRELILARYPWDGVTVSEVIAQALETHFAPGAGEPEFVKALTAGVTENTAALRALVGGELAIENISPRHPLAVAVLHARLDITEAQVIEAHHEGIRGIFTRMLEIIAAAEGELEVSRLDVILGLTALNHLLYSFHSRIILSVIKTYAQEQERQRLSGEQIRRRALRDLLAGSEPEGIDDDIDRLLHYRVSHTHLGVLLPRCDETAARSVMDELRIALKASSAVLLPLGLHRTAFWVGRHRQFGDEWRQIVFGVLGRSGLAASVSEPADGLVGLRKTYVQLQRVESVRPIVAADKPDEVLTYRDVQFDWLMLNDSEDAKAFVLAELGELAEESARAQTLRLTLATYLESGSKVATARLLQIHEHTVRNRLDLVEQMVSHPLSERRTEMLVALRLRRTAVSVFATL